jgi:type I restriction enzyme S subunit
MSEWKEYKLGEIVELNYGKGLTENKRISGNVPVYSSAGITGCHNKPLVNSEGLIIGRKGTIGKVYHSNVPFFCIDTAYYILPNEEKYDLKFLFYKLKTLGLEDLNEDSAVPGLNRETVYNQDILLPELSEQKSIASILSSLDDKIDLLHRQNATLEKMAETLFRQWFVERRPEPVEGDAKEEWKSIYLGTLINIGSGKGLKKEDFIDNGLYPIFGANGIIGRTNKFLFNEKLIFTGRVGTLGNIFRIEKEKVWLSDNTLVIQPYKYYNFVYFTLKFARLEDYNVGSTQPLIRQSDIKEIEISIPLEDMLLRFEEFCIIQFNKIKANQSQIRTLTALRDTLLPKLMKGEIKVQL